MKQASSHANPIFFTFYHLKRAEAGPKPKRDALKRYIHEVNFFFTPYLAIRLVKLCLLLNCVNQEIEECHIIFILILK